jgi:hypothetical protein
VLPSITETALRIRVLCLTKSQKGFIMRVLFAADVSERVADLVAQHDQGDRRAAARRLGIDQDCLTGLLSGDWNLFSLDGLAALVRGYGVAPASLFAPGTRTLQRSSDVTGRRHPRMLAT